MRQCDDECCKKSAASHYAPHRLDVLRGIVHKKNFVGCHTRFCQQSLTASQHRDIEAQGRIGHHGGSNVLTHDVLQWSNVVQCGPMPQGGVACTHHANSTSQRAWRSAFSRKKLTEQHTKAKMLKMLSDVKNMHS